MDNNAELRKEFQQKKKDAAQLRARLNSLHKEKEETFQKMRSYRDTIMSKSSRLQQLKQERDNLTKEVQDLKVMRDQLNAEVKEKSKDLKIEDDKKNYRKDHLDKHHLDNRHRESPGRLKAMITRLEETIETEVMSFEKEKQLYKKVKELKQQYLQYAEAEKEWKEQRAVIIGFSQKRKEAQQSHHSVQQKAEESQEKHEELLKVLGELKKARSDIKPLEDSLKRLRLDYDETKKKLDQTSERMKKLGSLFNEQEESSFKNKARKKTAEVQEKLKQRKKLSTEDILAFQALDE